MENHRISEPEEGALPGNPYPESESSLSKPQESEPEQVIDGDRAVSNRTPPVDRRRAARGEPEIETSHRPVMQPPAQRARPALQKSLPDAWHASFSGALTVSQLRNNEGRIAESVIEAILPSGDDRVQVENSHQSPWRWICSLIITAADGTQWLGTGWLAGPRTVITAGHCVYIHGRGGWAQQVDVYPGRRGTAALFSISASNLRTVEGWTQYQDSDFDYGAIILPEPAAGIGYFGFEAAPDDQIEDLIVNVYGYPADKQPGTLWGHSRMLERVLPRTVVYDVSTFGGQSGCPVYYKIGSKRYVIAVHNYGDITGNSGTRITDEVFDNLLNWRSETE